MRRTWADLGVALPAADFWRRAPDGYVYLNADLMAQAGRAVHGAAWLSAPPAPERGGLFGRWQTQGTIKRVQAQVDAAAQEVDGLNQRLTEWFAFVQRLRWTQADLLQVMEELEPRAQSVLQAYFALRAGLSAAQAEVAARLTEWLPGCPPQTILHLYAGLDGLPSVDAAYALAALRDAPDHDAAVQDFLTRYGHRGLDEMQPDARRWRDHPDVAVQLAALPVMHPVEAARAARQAAEGSVLGRLDGNQRRQFEPLLARARRLCRAVDVAWDGLARVMAAAQLWLRAVAVEAVAAGLIADPAEVHFLELEELKQVATGEWHRGRSERVREEVVQRQRQRAGGDLAACADEPARSPVAASPGAASGPAFRFESGGRYRASARRGRADACRLTRRRALLAAGGRRARRGGRPVEPRHDHCTCVGGAGCDRHARHRRSGCAGTDHRCGWERRQSRDRAPDPPHWRSHPFVALKAMV